MRREGAPTPQERYHIAAHKVMTGAGIEIAKTADTARSLKDVRTGINMAMSDASGLVRLLIAKGLFTEAEYLAAVAEAAEAEALRAEKRVRELLGSDKVTLG